MRLVQFTLWPGGSVYVNPEQVLWVQPNGDGTNICLSGSTRERFNEAVHVAESIDEVVRALSTDPALVQEHARLKGLAETTARSYTTWERTAEHRGTTGLSDAERHQWSAAEARAITTACELEAFIAAHPEFREAVRS